MCKRDLPDETLPADPSTALRDKRRGSSCPLPLSQTKHPSGRQSPTSKVSGGCFKCSVGSHFVPVPHPVLTQMTGKGGAVI